jgi:hypothetical protein
MNSYVRLRYIAILVFKTERGCILCGEHSEAEETVDNANSRACLILYLHV